jgi:hypothetical protein
MTDPVHGRMWASFAKLGAVAGAIAVAAIQLSLGLCGGPLGLAWAAWFLLFEIPVAMVLGALAGIAVGVPAQKLRFRGFPRVAQVASLATLGFVATASTMTAFGLLMAAGGAYLYPVPVTGLIGAIAFTPYGLRILDGYRILFAASCHKSWSQFWESV